MLSTQEKRRITNSCRTCRTSIYEGEPVYVRRNYSSSYASESWVQCAWCYDQWQVELTVNRKFWIKWWLGGTLLIIIATMVSIVAFPGLERVDGNQVVWYRLKLFSLGSWQIPLLALITFIVSLLLVKIVSIWFQPAIDRYKLRKQPIWKN